MPRPRTDIEPRVVAAARERFLHDGVDGASLRMIARDAGTSIGMIYYYFPTKDELFIAVVGDMYARLLADLEEALQGDAGLEERIRRVYRRIGEMSDHERQVLRLVMREALVSSVRIRRLIERTRLQHLAPVLEALIDGRKNNEVSSAHSPLLVALVTVAVGVAPQLIMRSFAEVLPQAGEFPTEHLPAELADLLFSGIGVAGRPARGD